MFAAAVNESRSCPGNNLGCNGTHPIVAHWGLAIPAIISSSLSCISAVIIVFSFIRWKDIRTGSRGIITFLSIADFFTALGYIFGSINYAINFHTKSSECSVFTYLCKIQSFITTTSSLSSFFWTSSLAIYLYLSLVHSKIMLVRKLLPVFHVVSWVLPLLISIPLVATGCLGYSYYAVSTWCFIGTRRLEGSEVYLVLLGGKFWEILTYVVVIVLYLLIKRHISKTHKGLRSTYMNSDLVAILRKSDKKLVAIPVVFVLLRCWGTLHYFYSLAVSSHIIDHCTTRGVAAGFTVLGVLQAIGDGGQGWGNFILYVMVSDKVRSKLMTCCQRNQSPPASAQLSERSSNVNPEGAINYGAVDKEVDVYEPTTT